jgi:hypothetical protein
MGQLALSKQYATVYIYYMSKAIQPPQPLRNKTILFQQIHTPSDETYLVPEDISIRFPSHTDVAPERLHLLAYIPWDDQYMEYIPKAYHDFFRHVLPHLHPRTTNVHTALSMSFLPELIEATSQPVDGQVLYIAVAVHDCGWSQVSHHEIADSLDYSGIAYTEGAAEAKAKHTIYGHAFSFQLLDKYSFNPSLTLEEKTYISDIVRFHERPHEYGGSRKGAAELLIACEADRLWPFTYQNFWLDTVRKGVEPYQYIENVAKAVNEMLLTEAGKKIARRLVAERRREVAQLKSLAGRE